jgi:hypothetical protein
MKTIDHEDGWMIDSKVKDLFHIKNRLSNTYIYVMTNKIWFCVNFYGTTLFYGYPIMYMAYEYKSKYMDEIFGRIERHMLCI